MVVFHGKAGAPKPCYRAGQPKEVFQYLKTRPLFQVRAYFVENGTFHSENELIVA
jgi:hypothetical protein